MTLLNSKIVILNDCIESCQLMWLMATQQGVLSPQLHSNLGHVFGHVLKKLMPTDMPITSASLESRKSPNPNMFIGCSHLHDLNHHSSLDIFFHQIPIQVQFKITSGGRSYLA